MLRYELLLLIALRYYTNLRDSITLSIHRYLLPRSHNLLWRVHLSVWLMHHLLMRSHLLLLGHHLLIYRHLLIHHLRLIILRSSLLLIISLLHEVPWLLLVLHRWWRLLKLCRHYLLLVNSRALIYGRGDRWRLLFLLSDLWLHYLIIR